METIVSSVAPPNIALIKYWGKRDDLLKLPLNDSVSITLDEKTLASTTTLVLGAKLGKDRFILNGKEGPDSHIAEALLLIRRRLGKKYPLIKKPVLLLSSNNFPTAAGIASSASGFAALAQAVAAAFGIKDKKEISILARLGSGSASRSVFGGFARWKAGRNKDGNDSHAVQIAPRSKWPEVVDVIAITNPERKKVSSKDGMERTMRTSDLCHCRLGIVGKRADAVTRAIRSRDFSTMATLTMRDSNAMHATMLDTWPPVMYMNDISRAIVYAVHEYNEKSGQTKAAYTFDAGPNAHIITTRKEAGKIARMLKKIPGVQRVIMAGVGEGSKAVETPKKTKQLLKRLLS
ncbi:Diphosphomevalonate decarboxylase [uncultured archaeon]|nr:Diphosphomevalonate decarboxylase [uncultured archaeon]